MSEYSRQIATIGSHAMNTIKNIKALVIGCETIGTECSKALVLMGINQIYLLDNINIKYGNSERYIFESEDIWKNNNIFIDTLCCKFLKKINPNANISKFNLNCYSNRYNINNLRNTIIDNNINVVVNTSLNVVNIEAICMDLNIPYIFGSNDGLFGYVFSNFGNNHICYDSDGEDTLEGFVSNIYYDSDNFICLEIDSIKIIPNSNLFVLILNENRIELEGKFSIVNKDHNIKYLLIKLNKNEFIEKLLVIDRNNIKYKEIKKKKIINHVEFLK